MKNYIMLVAACTTLGACSQTKSISTLEKKIPTTYAEKVDVVKEQVAIIPDWYLKPPKNDKAIYSSGTSASPDLQLSMDIAILNAKTILMKLFFIQKVINYRGPRIYGCFMVAVSESTIILEIKMLL